MPIYNVQAPDGKVYKVEGPENADPELLFATVAQKHKFASLTTEQLNAMPSAGTSIGDVGRSLGTGLVGGVKSIADVFGAGTDVSEYLGETMQGLQAGLTPERQAEMARRAELIERADKSGSLMQQAKAYLGGVTEAPLQTTVQALGTSAPTIVAGLATLPVSAPAGIAAGVGIISRLAVGAAQGVGEFKGSAYEAVKGHYLKEGKSPEEAARLAEEAQQYSADKALQIGGAALLGSLDAVLGSENIAMKAMRRASPTGKMTKEAVDAGIAALPEKALTKPSLTRAFGESVLGEAPLEGAQGAFGQYAQNVAMQQAGIDTPTEQGVFGSGLRDALVGGLAGGVFTPLQKSTMNSAYNIDQFLRQAKGEQEITAEAEAALKRKQETEGRVKTGLGVPTGEILALPAPAAKAEREIEPALIDLQNPVGTISRNELPADTLSYIDKYRTENNLPRLTSFSLEDVKDAMTSQNPEGERAALDSIIAAKTGYTGKEKYTAEDILNAAVEKNIAPDTKGFSDFLQRATGERDVNTMSQPQLFSAFNALKATKPSTTGEQIVLPEGSNATRFTTDQYNEGLTLLGKYLEQSEGKPLSMEQATDVVAAQTDLGDYASDILRVAANNDDVIVENGTVFQTVDKETGEITGTYGVKEDAASAAGKAATVQEARGPVVRSRIEEKQVKRAALPGGYELEEETLKEGERPAEYQIMVEGKAKPLATVLEENDVAGKVERLQGLRQKEAGKVLADIQKNETTVNKGRAALESMEARGLMDTEGYKKAQAQQARAEDILGRRIQRMLDQIEELSAPLKAKPAGKKQITRQAFKLTKEGKEVGKFPSRAAAEESVLAQLSDAELETLTTQEGPTANRAAKALEARKEQKAGKTGIKVKGTTAGVEAAGVYTQDVQAKIDALSKQLVPMLAKFGLQDVGLNIVRTLQAGAEGSYLDKLIQVTLTAEKPIIIMRHEALHALKDLGFFTPAQWDVLTKKANDEWIGKYLKGVNAEIDGKVMSRYDAYKAMGLTDEDIVEEAIADAFGAFELGTDKPTPGMIAAMFKRLQDFFAAFAQALGRAKIESAEEIFGKIERGELAKAGLEQTAKEKLSLGKTSAVNAWKADEATIKAADKYEEENGILPYVSEGFLDLPTDGTKYSLQKYNPEKHLSFDATLGLPINKNGLVTLYYHTTKDQAVKIGNKKVIPSEGRNRVYLTNESNGAGVLRQRGNFDQELDGSSVLVYVSPDMLQVDDTEYKDGRRDFYVPLAQGDYFNKKMKLQSIQKSRTSPITEVFSYTDHEEKITKAVKKYKDATPAERRKLVADSRKLLKQEHNIGSLLSENGKLEKTRLGDYDLDWEGNSVASMGLGLASAQQISDKVSTCPRSAICEGLCLGETSGGNFMFGGAASEDVGDIQKSSFRAAARMMQYLKTEALVINPEAFATVLQAEIDSLAKWSSSETQVKIEPETKKRTSVEKEIYQPAVRLNVTSDFKPTMFRAIIEQNPDTMFYDYTKLGSETIAPNHHLTYSSTGFGQIVNGEKVFFKDKSGKYDHNWATMRDRRLNNGENVAMAFSSKSGIPAYLVDEETGVQYKVWNGDDYDARFLDPKQPDGKGMIIGLKNKAGTLSEKTATQKTGGFFVQYDPKTDGDTVVVPDQAQFKSDRKVIPIGKAEKLSLRTFFPSAKEAENAANEKAPPQTREFKLFYGASTLIEEGRPQVMYHGSDTDISTFYENKPIFVTPDANFAQDFAEDRAKDNGKSASEARVYPLWVRAETPFDYENSEHVEQVMQRLIADQGATKFDSKLRLNKSTGAVDKVREEMRSGLWSVIEDKTVQDVIKQLGFDSFNVMEGGNKNLAVYSAAQVKSVTGNIGEFDREAKDIRFSLPTVSKAATDRVNATTTTREVKGFAERITDAISPKARSYFRAKAINRYNQLGVYDRKLAEKMGGVAFLADTSAEAGALFSDLGAGVTASALGFGDRNGGIPVYRNGVTTVDRSVKGLVASLAPLAAYGDPKVYQYYQYWAAVKRGTRLLEAGKERLINEGDKALAAELQKKFPEFIDVQKDYTAFNNGVVQYMVDTGVLSQERGNEYMKYADYVPFYRQADGETTIGPNIFQAIAGVKPPKKLKGSDAPLADFLETIVRNTQASIQAGMKNAAAQRAVNVASQVTEPGMGVERLNTKQSGPDIINVLEKGEQVSYRTVDSLLVDAIGSLHMPDIPFLSILSAPSDVLRNLVTKDPGFMMANLMRDSLSAWVTSGQKMTPIAGTVINFGKALAGKSPGMEAMMDAGIIGGYEFSANVESSGEKLATDLARKSGKEGLAAPLRAVRWLWEGLEKGTTASDAATRALVYERVMAETGNEAEALYRSLEVMNFNRKGSSPVIRVLTAAVPFFNARLQGLDLFYRASTGQMNMDNAKAIQKNFFVRGAMMAGLSTIYWFLTHDDEEYKKQEQETRDNNWLFPSAGIKIPTPFEVGVVFKTIPERILGYTFGDDTGKDFAKSMGSAMLSTFAFNPIPQTVKPIVEVATNFSFFTMRPIIGQGMEDVASKYQVGPSTSKAFEAFGNMTGLSPMKVEYLYKGYTGTMGMYLVDAVDSILNAASNSPNATKRFEQLPVIKRFALDPEARGNITQYYELKNSVDSTVKTMNLLEKTARPEDFSNYVQQNIGYLANKDYVRDLEKTMKELREMRTAVRSSGMSGDDKRESLKLIGQMENNLTSNIQTVKKTIASMQ